MPVMLASRLRTMAYRLRNRFFDIVRNDDMIANAGFILAIIFIIGGFIFSLLPWQKWDPPQPNSVCHPGDSCYVAPLSSSDWDSLDKYEHLSDGAP